MWYDKAFKGLCPADKAAATYLITNDNIGLSRVYKQPDLEVCFILKLTEEQWQKTKARLEKTGMYLFKEEWVYINNDMSYCNYKGQKKVEMARKKEISEIPRDILDYFKGLKTLSEGLDTHRRVP